MTMKDDRYFIGLDMGTNSVGWAVTDENYVIQRAKGKDMWGVRLFSEAKTAAERRSFRVGRRRRQRQTARINYLNMCFAPEIEKIDSGFLMRLSESKYHLEDRSKENSQKYAIFNDKDYTDSQYFKQYPTIFHLRSELLRDNPIVPHDIRLVYLALLNMYKHRGHFLNDNLEIDNKTDSISDAYKSMSETAAYFDITIPLDADTQIIEEVLSDRSINKKEKLERISTVAGIDKRDNKEAYELLKLICGMSSTLFGIFGDVVDEENKKYSFSFSDKSFEEKAIEIVDIIGDEYFELIASAKEVFDIGLLSGIMKGYRYLSDARVSDYKSHHEDLILLKQYLKDYDRLSYESFFRKMGEGNYSAYVGSVNSDKEKVRRNEGKGRDLEDLYKTVKNIIKKLPKDAQDDPRAEIILTRIDNGTFLGKQLTASNGVIPYQVHAREMKKILDNASTYLPFLNEKDESGLTTSERILKMFCFSIPYYVGPLGQSGSGEKGANTWVERIAPGKIYPWNISEKIDMEKTAEEFINRMLRKCTYLSNQKALPKQSLLYEKYMVLNELNNLRVHGEKITIEQKQDIYNTLFMKGKRVTNKQLVSYFIANGIMSKDESADAVISGIDGDFKCYLSSVNKFAPILGKENVYSIHKDMVEKIIFWATIFGDDKKTLRKRIKAEFGNTLDDSQIKRISGLSFSGWGNLSKEFLLMPGKKGSPEEEKSIICSLWESNENLMELLGRTHTYREEIEDQINKEQKDLFELTIEDLNDMYLSPSVKRMVWQTVRILKDVCEVKKVSPDRIFVEMPREDGEKGKRSLSRKRKLEALYKDQKDFLSEIGNYEEKDFKQKKLYLYYLQNGRSVYTGKPIDLENLLGNNSNYDIDHIYPRHYTKDDSLDNNLVLVEKEVNNDDKGGDYPLDRKIQEKMGPFWRDLLRKGFMTKEKYSRLTRTTGFSEEEQANFIARQLVETRQGTKAITQILNQAFPETQIVFSKAGVVSSFRQKFDIPKVRSLNSCHHAHDAYLNIVAGNAYYVKFTANPLNFIKEASKYEKDPSYKYHMDKIFDYKIERNGEVAWIAQNEKDSGTIKTVKKMLGKTSLLMTSKPYMEHGGISQDTTIYCAKKAKKSRGEYFPVRTGDDKLSDVTKYGGITVANTAYALVEYTEQGKTSDKDMLIRALIRVPIYLGSVTEKDNKLYTYLTKKIRSMKAKKVIENLTVRMYPIRFGDVIILDGYKYLLGGVTENYIYLKDFTPLYLSFKEQAYIKKIEKAVNTGDFSETKDGVNVITVNQNVDLFNIFVDKLHNSVFKNKKSNIIEILANGKDAFAALDVSEQCHVLMQVISWFNTATQTIDLIALKDSGGTAHSGKLTMKSTISDYNEVYLIQSSPSGLYQKKVDLLKV